MSHEFPRHDPMRLTACSPAGTGHAAHMSGASKLARSSLNASGRRTSGRSGQ